MKRLIVAVVLTLIALKPVSARSAIIEYTFQKRDSTNLLITLSFTGNQSGSTLLTLPNEWAGQSKLYNSISQITAISTQTTISQGNKPFEYQVSYRPGAKVTLTYVLSKGFIGALKYPLYFRPVIEPDYFFFEGYSGLVLPDIADNVQLSCKITYKGFSKDDFIGNSFFANQSSDTFTTDIKHLSNSFFCAGNYRTKTIEKDGHKIVMVITGKFLFSDNDAFSATSNIIFGERKFWNDPSSRYFFTALLPLTDNGITGGTAHFNSFFMTQSTNLAISQGFLPILSHEYFHTWIGQGLTNPNPDELNKWFSEGFTDYYSIKLLKVMGAISKQDFVAKINQCIKEYYLSPYFTLDNQQLLGKYFENSSMKVLSYRRGLTIAFMLDNKIAENGEFSLDDLMKTLYNQSKPGLIFSKPLFDHLVVNSTDTAILSAINNAVAGNNSQLTHYLLGSKIYKLYILRLKIFDIGFDLEASKSVKKITGLKPGSNAEKAGLVENMEITNNFSIWNNNTEKPLRVQVVRDNQKEWISYIPVSDKLVSIPQMAINVDSKDERH